MTKSKKCYRLAFYIGVALLPFVIIMDRDMLRQWWFVVPLVLGMLVVFGLTFKAMRLEERGE